jgi:glyoxylase-like metal-dependent hydrolase (beta-lactamase superfamily II)
VTIDIFTGGAFETNCFYIPSARLLVDAPEGAAGWLEGRGYRVETLLLTHGHVDHVWDAARIHREHSCEVVFHADTLPMVRDVDFYTRLGFPWSVEPLEGGTVIGAEENIVFGGLEFQVLEVPGHCPGSLCFLLNSEALLFGGDVLFAGGVGRWDLPGGNREVLLKGIREKLLPLGDALRVLPGHGPGTTIGWERLHNPYLQD